MKNILSILFLILPVFAQAQNSTSDYGNDTEKIYNYQVFITVQTDASILVEENIKVYAGNIEIDRGIYRDIPLQKYISTGFIRSFPFTIIEILKDGKSEPYFTENQMGSTRIYIGDEDVYLQPGVYQYKITYRIDRALDFGSNYTELYWNATGHGWAFPIENASVTVTLPKNVINDVFFMEAYPGVLGSTNSGTMTAGKDGSLKFTSSDALDPGSGVTVLIRWKTGVIPAPAQSEKLMIFAADNKGFFIMLGGILIVFIYYLITWFLVGRDPKKGSIMTYFDPPESLSPASMRYILNMKYDEKILSAAIVNMAVKGHLSIKESDDSYILSRINDTLAGLSDEEKAISNALFSGGKNIEVSNSHHSEFAAAIEKCKKSLKSRFEITYFVLNLKIFIPGLVLCIIIMFTGIFADSLNFVTGFMLLWLSFWTVGVAAILKMMFTFWKTAITAANKKSSKFAAAIVFTLVGLLFVGAEIGGIYLFFMFLYSSIWVAPLAAIAILINYLFFRLLKAPTLAGRQVMDKIEGFRMFLDVAERHRMELLNPPVKDIKTFEKFLPYALAFGIEENWAGYFNDVLSASSASQKGGYSPAWYHGSSFMTSNIGQFAGSLSSGLSSAFSSASVSPSSGSGGGGFSGGGGGGGGGGGW